MEDTAANADNRNSMTSSQSKKPAAADLLTVIKRKVLLKNVFKFDNVKDIQKMCQHYFSIMNNDGNAKMSLENIKKPPKNNWAILTFSTEEMATRFISFVNTGGDGGGPIKHLKKGYRLEAQAAGGGENEQDQKKRPRCDNDNDNEDGSEQIASMKRSRTAVLTDDELRDVITPYWKLTREEQLIKKQRLMIKQCCMGIVKEMKRIFRVREKEQKRNPKYVEKIPMYEWVTKKRPIDMDDIIPSPCQFGYRNKCEFTFGYMYSDSTNRPATNEPMESNENGNDHALLKKTPVVGYITRGWSGGVARPHGTYNTPGECCAIANVLDKFLITSPLPPYDSKTHRGIWRTVLIRFSRRTNSCLVLIQHAPPSGGAGARENGSDDYSKHFDSERERLTHMLTAKPLSVPSNKDRGIPNDENQNGKDAGTVPSEIQVTSLFFQEYDGLSMAPPEHPVQHAHGNLFMEERLGKCIFQISPGAFFQVNTLGAELLYKQVVDRIKDMNTSNKKKQQQQQQEKSEVNSHDSDANESSILNGINTNNERILLLDVCCGTGTIGITCMKENVANALLGVDVSAPAINDAKKNSIRNGLINSADYDNDDINLKVNFVASRAELVLAKEIEKVKDQFKKDNVNLIAIVAVVDPARDGLHSDVVRALRGTKEIDRLIYVSCNPTKSLVRDAGILCAPATKKYPGVPFWPSGARPVDMFPMTTHCEMVMVFDRLHSKTGSGNKKKDHESEKA